MSSRRPATTIARSMLCVVYPIAFSVCTSPSSAGCGAAAAGNLLRSTFGGSRDDWMPGCRAGCKFAEGILLRSTFGGSRDDWMPGCRAGCKFAEGNLLRSTFGGSRDDWMPGCRAGCKFAEVATGPVVLRT